MLPEVLVVAYNKASILEIMDLSNNKMVDLNSEDIINKFVDKILENNKKV